MNTKEKNNQKGGTRKIRDIKPLCLHPEHKPPKYCVFEPGEYEHICPGCGYKTIFTVPRISCSNSS